MPGDPRWLGLLLRGGDVRDPLADEQGRPIADMPVTLMRLQIDDRPQGGVIVTIESTFPSLDALEQLIAMGMEEGLKEAMAQIDDILAG